jgi:lysylphosphatidylglycerol synthetase-like protein (DUF2156 family)
MENKKRKSIFVLLLIAFVFAFLQSCIVLLVFKDFTRSIKIAYYLSLIITALTFFGFTLFNIYKFKKFLYIPLILYIASRFIVLISNFFHFRRWDNFSYNQKKIMVANIIVLIFLIICVIASLYPEKLSFLAIMMLSMILSYSCYSKLKDTFNMTYNGNIIQKSFYIIPHLWEIPFLVAMIMLFHNNIKVKSKSPLSNEILELQNLVKKGLMSQEEYETKRKELIARY